MRTGATELLIRHRMRALTQTLPAAQGGDVEAIHQARVATRRLREAVPLVARGTAGRKLLRRIRRLTRALGPIRELDVAILMLDELAERAEVPKPAVACLHQVIRDERRRLLNGLARDIERCRLDKLVRKTVAAARKRDAQQAVASPKGPDQLALARRRAARRAERLRDTMETAAGIYLPDRLHDVRIAVKKLRYAMEIVRELSGSRATARILALKRAQDLLGRMHDLEVLIARTRAVQGTSAPKLRLSADLDRLVRHLETECRQLHGRYMAARRSLLAICDHVAAAGGRSHAA